MYDLCLSHKLFGLFLLLVFGLFVCVSLCVCVHFNHNFCLFASLSPGHWFVDLSSIACCKKQQQQKIRFFFQTLLAADFFHTFSLITSLLVCLFLSYRHRSNIKHNAQSKRGLEIRIRFWIVMSVCLCVGVNGTRPEIEMVIAICCVTRRASAHNRRQQQQHTCTSFWMISFVHRFEIGAVQFSN